MSALEESIALNTRPHPDDFVTYLPWACNQLELEHSVVITKGFQSDYVGSSTERTKSRSKSKTRPMRSRGDTTSERDDKTTTTDRVSFVEEGINITVLFDSNGDLVKLMFDNNKFIPRELLKTIAVILKFYPQLNSVVVDRGADLYTIYELEKFLTISNITNICLDDCPINGGNYDTLLNQEVLKQLSLCRCHLADDTIGKIAVKLKYPSPAAKSLAILNLTSNRITDVGATSLANTLRSNRCLVYLNLAGNWITDDGAAAILRSLQEFCLTPEEVLSSKSRYISYLKMRNDLIASKVKEKREGDLEVVKKKPGRSTPTSVRKKTKDTQESYHSVRDAFTSNTSDVNLLERVYAMIQSTLGDFDDPFSTNNCTVKDSALYCLGNNTLCYLNLAYNNLSYLILNKLLNTLLYQRQVDRKPCGLINVLIDGNKLPVVCQELLSINQILETTLQRSIPSNKKQKTKTR